MTEAELTEWNNERLARVEEAIALREWDVPTPDPAVDIAKLVVIWVGSVFAAVIAVAAIAGWL